MSDVAARVRAAQRAAQSSQSWEVEDEEAEREEQLRGIRNQLVADLRDDKIEVPPLPKVAVELHQLACSPEPDLRRAQKILERDPQLAGRVVQVASSPVYGGRAVTGIEMAVVRLGATPLRDIAMAVAMGKVFRCKGLDGYVRSEMQHAFSVASASRDVCAMLGLDKHYGFLCGLFHDIGRLTIGMAVAQYSSREKQPVDLKIVEKLADKHHEQVGEYVLSKWGLHNMVKSVAAKHHKPSEAGAAAPIAMAVAAADKADRIEAEDAAERSSKLSNCPEPYQAGLGPAQVDRLAKAIEEARSDDVLSSLVS